MEDNGLNPSSEEKKDPMEKSDAQPKKPFVPGWYFVFPVAGTRDQAALLRDFPDADYYASSATASFAFYKAPALSEAEIDVLSDRNSNQTLLGSATLTYLVCEAHLRDMERIGNQNAKKPEKVASHIHDESCLPPSMPPEVRKMILEIMNAKDGGKRPKTMLDVLFGL